MSITKISAETEQLRAERDKCAEEINRLKLLVRWAYGKLYTHTFSEIDELLKVDEMRQEIHHDAYLRETGE